MQYGYILVKLIFGLRVSDRDLLQNKSKIVGTPLMQNKE
jgi:hypothetical protein